MLRWTRYGLALRAVGSDATRAHRLGAHVTITQVSAYVLCSLFTAAGGIMLASQVAHRRSAAWASTTRSRASPRSCSAARASSAAAAPSSAPCCGAVLIQEIVTSTTFLQIGTEWQYYLPGILILVGAGIYSRTRTQQGFAIGAEPAASPQ